jgi:glycosyltransferase involved in cell wall biosynthesis
VKKKVCIIASYAPSILNFRKELIIEIAKSCDVYVCAPFINQEIKDKIEKIGVVFLDVRISSSRIDPLSNIKYLYALFTCFRRVKPDIVLGYTIKPVIWGSLAAKLAGVKQISSMITGLGYSFIDLDSFKRKFINKVACTLYKYSLSANQMVFFQNKDDKQYFKDKLILRNTPSIVINGSGVNLIHYFHCEDFPKKTTFLMIGRLLRDKGIYEYIEAARQIKAIYKNVDFNLVGSIDENPSSITSQELKTWCDQGLINFLGKQEDVRDSIKSTTVYVLPSYREGTPRSVLEAMAMGRPIITTDAPGCRDTVVHGVNGYLVPVKNVKKLVESMKMFIENRALAKKFGEKSREIAVHKYDVNRVNRDIMAALNLC